MKKMINCAKAREMSNAYVDNELNDADSTAYEEHISCCESCHEEYDMLKKISTDLASSAAPLPEGFAKRMHTVLVKEQFQSQKTKESKKFIFPYYRAASVVAAALVIAVVGKYGIYDTYKNVTEDTARIATELNEGKNIDNGSNATPPAVETPVDTSTPEAKSPEVKQISQIENSPVAEQPTAEQTPTSEQAPMAEQEQLMQTEPVQEAMAEQLQTEPTPQAEQIPQVEQVPQTTQSPQPEQTPQPEQIPTAEQPTNAPANVTRTKEVKTTAEKPVSELKPTDIAVSTPAESKTVAKAKVKTVDEHAVAEAAPQPDGVMPASVMRMAMPADSAVAVAEAEADMNAPAAYDYSADSTDEVLYMADATAEVATEATADTTSEAIEESAMHSGSGGAAAAPKATELIPAEISIYNSGDGSKMMFKKYLFTILDGSEISDNGETMVITVDAAEYDSVMQHLRSNEYVKSVKEGTPFDGKAVINIK